MNGPLEAVLQLCRIRALLSLRNLSQQVCQGRDSLHLYNLRCKGLNGQLFVGNTRCERSVVDIQVEGQPPDIDGRLAGVLDPEVHGEDLLKEFYILGLDVRYVDPRPIGTQVEPGSGATDEEEPQNQDAKQSCHAFHFFLPEMVFAEILYPERHDKAMKFARPARGLGGRIRVTPCCIRMPSTFP